VQTTQSWPLIYLCMEADKPQQHDKNGLCRRKVVCNQINHAAEKSLCIHVSKNMAI